MSSKEGEAKAIANQKIIAVLTKVEPDGQG
jgi:hypothetical protein